VQLNAPQSNRYGVCIELRTSVESLDLVLTSRPVESRINGGLIVHYVGRMVDPPLSRASSTTTTTVPPSPHDHHDHHRTRRGRGGHRAHPKNSLLFFFFICLILTNFSIVSRLFDAGWGSPSTSYFIW
jgi:hypothetical protein